jgi:AcrR family transcriptional regulator
MKRQRMTNRKKQLIDTRRKIYTTALRLFYAKGYDKVTVDDICKKVGVSKGAFYDHFKSKDQVIVDLFLKVADQIYAKFVSTELDSQKNSLEKLFLLGMKAVDYSKSVGMDTLIVSYRAQINLNKRAGPIASEKRTIFKIVQKLVEEGQASGEIRTDLSRDDITRIIVRYFRGIVYNWCAVKGRYDLKKETEKALIIMIKGLRPD